MSKERNSDRLIAVTGASRGIGAAIAVELATRGFRVACLSRGGRGPETNFAPELDARFMNRACDVVDEASVSDALEAVTRNGALYGLVNNAVIHVEAPSHTMDTVTYERVMQTNATAVFTACRAAYPYLVKSGEATIVNIGSFFDKIGVKRNLAYCASKAAVGAITRCLAVEWAAHGIRVLDVAPGYVLTDLNRDALERGPVREFLEKRIPRGLPGTPNEIARAVAALFSEGITFLTGETIYIDGGQGMAH